MRTSNFRAVKKQQYRSAVYVSNNPEKREKWRKLPKVKKTRNKNLCYPIPRVSPNLSEWKRDHIRCFEYDLPPLPSSYRPEDLTWRREITLSDYPCVRGLPSSKKGLFGRGVFLEKRNVQNKNRWVKNKNIINYAFGIKTARFSAFEIIFTDHRQTLRIKRWWWLLWWFRLDLFEFEMYFHQLDTNFKFNKLSFKILVNTMVYGSLWLANMAIRGRTV